MSVFTAVNPEELQRHLQARGLGRLIGLRGIATGIENSNYYVDTEGGAWVLTLFETVPEPDLPYFMALTTHLANRGLPCPRPRADAKGTTLFHLSDKPAALVECLPGRSLEAPGSRHCAQVGEVLARMHLEGQTFAGRRANPRAGDWRRQAVARLEAIWPESDSRLAEEELHWLERQDFSELPVGRVHCDLFRDNVLFEADHLSGILDFYYACDDLLLYDLAITVNDWCRDASQAIDQARYQALVGAYCALRPPTATEARAWGAMLRMAAMRFWLSRALDLHFPRSGELTYTKNPDEFRERLLACRSDTPPLPLMAESQ